MKIHYLQHVPFETPGCIEDWVKKNEYELTGTFLYDKEYALPGQKDFDMLIILGGPMGVYDEDKYDWLKDEKHFIKETINNNKIVLGICFGAQLIAEALKAEIYPDYFSEIGWFPLQKYSEARDSMFFNFFPNNIHVFHWHKDTFSLPRNSIKLAKSSVCKNQAFQYDDKVLALQFHLEVKPSNVEALINNCMDEIEESLYIQNSLSMKSLTPCYYENNNVIMFEILDRLSGNFNSNYENKIHDLKHVL